MNRILFYELLYLQILSFMKSFLYYTQTKSYYILLYDVPFLSIRIEFFIKLKASFLLTNIKLTR